ncbi:hypothetical protein D3C76_1690610 [compost metagenome]
MKHSAHPLLQIVHIQFVEKDPQAEILCQADAQGILEMSFVACSLPQARGER